ncbi:MAG: hypothetical protein WCT46_01320 [Candidatus Gracilibacteria bacterium]
MTYGGHGDAIDDDYDDDESEDEEDDDDESVDRPDGQIIGRKTRGTDRVSREDGGSRKMESLRRSFGTRGVWGTRPNPRKVGR